MECKIKESGVSATVENIEWERIHLTLTVRLKFEENKICNVDELAFYAVNNLGECGIKFDVSRVESDLVKLHVNVTNNGEIRCVPRGTYRILYVKNCIF